MNEPYFLSLYMEVSNATLPWGLCLGQLAESVVGLTEAELRLHVLKYCHRFGPWSISGRSETMEEDRDSWMVELAPKLRALAVLAES